MTLYVYEWVGNVYMGRCGCLEDVPKIKCCLIVHPEMSSCQECWLWSFCCWAFCPFFPALCPDPASFTLMFSLFAPPEPIWWLNYTAHGSLRQYEKYWLVHAAECCQRCWVYRPSFSAALLTTKLLEVAWCYYSVAQLVYLDLRAEWTTRRLPLFNRIHSSKSPERWVELWLAKNEWTWELPAHLEYATIALYGENAFPFCCMTMGY